MKLSKGLTGLIFEHASWCKKYICNFKMELADGCNEKIETFLKVLLLFYSKLFGFRLCYQIFVTYIEHQISVYVDPYFIKLEKFWLPITKTTCSKDWISFHWNCEFDIVDISYKLKLTVFCKVFFKDPLFKLRIIPGFDRDQIMKLHLVICIFS